MLYILCNVKQNFEKKFIFFRQVRESQVSGKSSLKLPHFTRCRKPGGTGGRAEGRPVRYMQAGGMPAIFIVG